MPIDEPQKAKWFTRRVLNYFPKVVAFMKKMMRILSAAAIIVMVVVVGSGRLDNAPSAVLGEPPWLVAAAADGRARVEALCGTYSWRFGEGEKGVGVASDSVHPLEAKAWMAPLVATHGTESVGLTFAVSPDAVSVRAWDTDAWGRAEWRDTQAVDVSVRKNDRGAWQMVLLENDAVYSISAEWNRFENFGGEAFESFYTELQP